MNDINIYANNKSGGGTITVINKLSKLYNVRIINISDLKNLNHNSLVIAVQPKSILILYFVSIFREINDYYILDTHPGALFFPKKFIYIILSLLVLLRKKNKGIVPNGPLSSLWPFKMFKIVDWSIFVEEKFEINIKSKISSFVYLGTCTSKKGFKKFINFSKVNSDYKFNIHGYASNQVIKKIKENYDGEYNKELQLNNNNILLWTSSIESFGLTFREYIKSGGKVIFLREPDYFDCIKDAVYVYGNKYKDLANLLLVISKIACQENILQKEYLKFNDAII